MDKNKSLSSAPARSAAVERKPNSNTRVDITGSRFLHFQRLPSGGRNLRQGRVIGLLGNDRWLLEFDAGTYRFCNVFSADQLEAFVLLETDADAKAFVAALGANPLASPMGRGMPSLTEGNA